MIPLGEAVPRRTRPLVSLIVASSLAAGALVFHALATPEHRIEALWTWGATAHSWPLPALLSAWVIEPSWLAGAANAAVILLFGPALEDRLGHARFAVTLLTAAALGASLPILVGSTPRLPAAGAASPAAAVVAGHAMLFPPSTLILWMPGRGGGTLRELPAVWAIGAWVALVPGGIAHLVAPGAASWPPLPGALAGAVLGAGGAKLLAIRKRLTVDWWDRS